MNPEKVQKVVNYVLDASQRGQVPWKATPDEQFQANFEGSSIVVGHSASLGFGSAFGLTPGPYLQIFNRDGIKILTLDGKSAPGYGVQPETINKIYLVVKNLVFRYDETFDDILQRLGP